MKLEELKSEWQKDSVIDTTNIGHEAAKIPQLHHKYMMEYVAEGYKLKRLREEFKVLNLKKTEYYRGDMDIAEIKQLGWPKLHRKIMKTDAKQYVDADSQIIEFTLKIGAQELKVELLESIIKQLNNRSFIIRDIIEFEKFRVGA